MLEHLRHNQRQNLHTHHSNQNLCLHHMHCHHLYLHNNHSHSKTSHQSMCHQDRILLHMLQALLHINLQRHTENNHSRIQLNRHMCNHSLSSIRNQCLHMLDLAHHHNHQQNRHMHHSNQNLSLHYMHCHHLYLHSNHMCNKTNHQSIHLQDSILLHKDVRR